MTVGRLNAVGHRRQAKVCNLLKDTGQKKHFRHLGTASTRLLNYQLEHFTSDLPPLMFMSSSVLTLLSLWICFLNVFSCSSRAHKHCVGCLYPSDSTKALANEGLAFSDVSTNQKVPSPGQECQGGHEGHGARCQSVWPCAPKINGTP